MARKAETNIQLSLEEENRIIKAIAEAEKMTSGEIRVHLTGKKEEDSLLQAQQIFKELKMENTALRNAVLIHISLGSKTFAIYGDKGINEVVANDFWDETKDLMQSYFVKNQLIDGICTGVLTVGEQLKRYFPIQTNDVNELSNEITYD